MVPETEQQKAEREAQQAMCEHVWEDVLMPRDWERMSSVMDCNNCGASIPITVIRVES